MYFLVFSSDTLQCELMYFVFFFRSHSSVNKCIVFSSPDGILVRMNVFCAFIFRSRRGISPTTTTSITLGKTLQGSH